MNVDQICNDALPPMPNQSKYSWKDIFYSLKSVYLCGGDCVEDLQSHLRTHFANNPFVKLASPDTVLRRMSQLAEQIPDGEIKRGAVAHLYCTNSKVEGLNIDILKKLGVYKSGKLNIYYDHAIELP